MDKLENFLTTVSKFNVNIDTDTLWYYWYKVELMSNLFGILYVVLFVLWIWLFIYFISKS